MKNFKALLRKTAAVCVAAVTLSAAAVLPASAAEYLYVSGAETGAVYLRTAPASSNNYGTLTNGTMVESIGWARGYDGVGYNQVRVNGVTGWITTRYLSSYYNSYSYSYGYTRSRVVGVDNSIYLWKNSYSGSSYGTIRLGGTVYVDYGSYSNGRYKAHCGGQYGWVTASYVTPY
ncbi:MAG: hypothetical protein SOS24_04350 [Clostridia bacterium]|nr:hypothetical protein [Clostridia bacterium]